MPFFPIKCIEITFERFRVLIKMFCHNEVFTRVSYKEIITSRDEVSHNVIWFFF